ncbi:Putative LOC100575639, partial [Caligus rogercresseyi]
AINIVNDWFDSMNSRSIYSKKKLSCGLGIHFHEQMSALNEMERLVFSMKVIGKTYQLPFRKGILISIRSTRALFNNIKTDGMKFLLTARLNQDCLENVFSRVRALTGNNHHPSPVEALRRLKILLIGKNHDLILRNPAVEVEEDNEDD